jgi:hypothetical protein
VRHDAPGGALIMDMLNGRCFGCTIEDGSYAEVDVLDATVESVTSRHREHAGRPASAMLAGRQLPSQVSASSETLVSEVSATSETLVQNCYKGLSV